MSNPNDFNRFNEYDNSKYQFEEIKEDQIKVNFDPTKKEDLESYHHND